MAPDSGELNERQQRVKRAFEEEVGYWAESYEDVLRLDTQFFEHYKDLLAHPHRNGHLEPKVRDFVLIAVNSVTTQLYNDGTRIHIRNALVHGATFEEVREVLERTSGLGIHSVTEGVPLLLEAVGNPPQADDEMQEKHQRLRAEFEEKRGYWSDIWKDVMAMDSTFFEHYTSLSSHPSEVGPLDPKVNEFLSIAYDSAATNLFRPGLEAHIRNALDHGASEEEIMEVLELASIVGFHTLSESAPILIEEAVSHDALPDWWMSNGD